MQRRGTWKEKTTQNIYIAIAVHEIAQNAFIQHGHLGTDTDLTYVCTIKLEKKIFENAQSKFSSYVVK